MRRKGQASLWVGNAVDVDALDAYMEITYSDDGDRIRSRFMVDFGILDYDDEFREADIVEPPSSLLKELLLGFSYEKALLAGFTELIGDGLDASKNVVIILLDFVYTGSTNSSDSLGGIQYVGAVPYAAKARKRAR